MEHMIEIRTDPALFMEWFNGLVNNLIGVRFPTGDPQCLSYVVQVMNWEFHVDSPRLGVDRPIEQGQPLELVFHGFYSRSIESHCDENVPRRGKLSAALAAELERENVGPVMTVSIERVTVAGTSDSTRVRIVSHASHMDPVSILLRAIALKWEHTREQYTAELLEALRPRISQEEWTEWKELEWLPSAPGVAAKSLISEEARLQVPASDAPFEKWADFFNPPGRPGRPTLREDIWAIVEVCVQCRDVKEVYQEWVNRDEVRERQLVDAWDSFKKLLERGRKKLGLNE